MLSAFLLNVWASLGEVPRNLSTMLAPTYLMMLRNSASGPEIKLPGRIVQVPLWRNWKTTYPWAPGHVRGGSHEAAEEERGKGERPPSTAPKPHQPQRLDDTTTLQGGQQGGYCRHSEGS